MWQSLFDIPDLFEAICIYLTMNNRDLFFAILLTCAGLTSLAHETDNFKDKIQSINNEIEKNLIDEKVNGVLNYYTTESVVMPEFHKTLYGKENIHLYFQYWLDMVNVNSFKRTIYEIHTINNGFLLETGTFKNNFTQANNDSFLYEGKYIRIWNIGDKDSLTIISEIWGSNSYLDRAKFPSIENNKSDNIPGYRVSRKIKEEVRSQNQIITDLVKNRDGEKHSTFFTTDAIYMPYYMPMLVGIKKVRSYFIEHEKPGDVQIDSLQINTSKIIDMGNFALEHGYYRIRGKGENNTSWVVTGKSINLWKRDKKGKLMLYRQMVNHD